MSLFIRSHAGESPTKVSTGLGRELHLLDKFRSSCQLFGGSCYYIFQLGEGCRWDSRLLLVKLNIFEMQGSSLHLYFRGLENLFGHP